MDDGTMNSWMVLIAWALGYKNTELHSSPSMSFCTNATNIETPAEIFVSGGTFCPSEVALRPLAHYPRSSKKLWSGKDWKSKKEFVTKARSTWKIRAISHTSATSADWTYFAEKFPTFRILCKKVCNENRHREKNSLISKKVASKFKGHITAWYFSLWQANHVFSTVRGQGSVRSISDKVLSWRIVPAL